MRALLTSSCNVLFIDCILFRDNDICWLTIHLLTLCFHRRYVNIVANTEKE